MVYFAVLLPLTHWSTKDCSVTTLCKSINVSVATLGTNWWKLTCLPSVSKPRWRWWITPFLASICFGACCSWTNVEGPLGDIDYCPFRWLIPTLPGLAFQPLTNTKFILFAPGAGIGGFSECFRALITWLFYFRNRSGIVSLYAPAAWSYQTVWLVHSFIKGTLSKLKSTRASSMTLLVTNLTTDLVIAVTVCTILGTRRSDYPESRYVVLVYGRRIILIQISWQCQYRYKQSHHILCRAFPTVFVSFPPIVEIVVVM